MSKLYWKLYYKINPVKSELKSDIIIQHCRINGIPYINAASITVVVDGEHVEIVRE